MGQKDVYAARRERFQALVRTYGTQAEASERLGMSPSQVSHLVTGVKNIGEQLARRIEDRAGLAAGSLVDPEMLGLGNVSQGIALQGDIPLIDWQQVGVWVDTGTLGPDSSPSIEHYSITRRHSAKTFALRVSGDSMWNPTGRPTYHDGDIVICDPGQAADAVNLDRVVARLLDTSIPDDQSIVFKQLVVDGPHRYLRSLNPQYDPIRCPFEILALQIALISV